MQTLQATPPSEFNLSKNWAKKALPFPGETDQKFKPAKIDKVVSACKKSVSSSEESRGVIKSPHWKRAKKQLEKGALTAKASHSLLWALAYATSPDCRRGLMDWHVAELGLVKTVELVLEALPGLEEDQLQFDWRWETDYLFQLRRHLCQASEADYEACVQSAKERLGLSRRVYVRSVFLFPGQTHWITDYPHPQNFLDTTWMLASVVDKETAEKIVPDADLRSFKLVDHNLLGTFVKGLGALSAPYIVGVIPEKLDATDAKFIAQALGSVKSEVSLDKLLELEPESKHIRPGLEHFFSSFPLWSLQYLCRERKAESWIRFLLRQDPELVKQLDPSEQAFLEDIAGEGPATGVTPEHLKTSSKSSLPSWFDLVALELPRLKESKQPLSHQAVESLAQELMSATSKQPSKALLETRHACDSISLARFAWSLFEQWLGGGGKTKDEWAFLALGLLGDEETAGLLAPLISKWPGESHSARAVKGLDVLHSLDNQLAQMHLYNFSQQAKSPSLKEKATELVEKLAADQGLSLEELADRLVPTLGLEADGFLYLDYGSRTFRVGFDQQLNPVVLDSEGKRLKSLPKVGKRDDPEKGKESQRLFKIAKSESRRIAKHQLQRLENSMCLQRRWRAADFEQYLVNHPLMFGLIKRLIWSVSRDEKLVHSFRVAEDRTLATVDDEQMSLGKKDLVGLLHPLEMTDEEKDSWREVLSDYQLLQPLAQLDRETFLASEEELKDPVWDGVYDEQVESVQILSLLNRGWTRGHVADGGVFRWVAKEVGPDLRAFLVFEPGIDPMEPHRNPRADLESLVLGKEDSLGKPQGLTPFSFLSPILFSELRRDLESIL